MTLARASGSLTRPWGLAKAELDGIFGDAQRSSETYFWTVTFRLYTLTVTVDRSTGDIEVAVSTNLPYDTLAIASLLVTIAITWPSMSTIGVFLAVSCCLIVAAIGLVPGLYHFQWLHHRVPEIYSTDTTWITPTVALPVIGVLVSMWAITPSLLFRALTLLIATFLLVITLYAVGWVPESLRRQQIVLAFAFFSGLPLLVTVGNLGLVSHAAQLVTPRQLTLIVWGLGIHTGVVLIVYSYLCLLFVRNIDKIPNHPVSSLPARIAWFGYFLLLNLASVILTVGLLIDRWWFTSLNIPRAEMVIGHQSLGMPFAEPVVSVAITVLALPLFCVVGLWMVHFYHWTARALNVANRTTRDSTIDAAVPVRIVDTERPLAHVTQILPGRPVIVVSSGLAKSLSDEEFNAVIAHEEYHARNRDPLWNTLSTIFGIAVGGRNVLIASYDYPHVERAADQYAAAQCGPAAVISALRSIERLGTSSTPHAQFADGPYRSRVSALLSAPYRVLFGSVVIANAHATVDERIEYLDRFGD